MRLLERSRAKYATADQYEHAAEKCKEIASIRGKKRQLQSEITQLQKLAKSARYHNSKLSKSKHGKSDKDPR